MPKSSPSSEPASPISAPAARMPRWVPGAVAAVLLVAAAVVGGTSGWILLAAATLVIGWLLVISWPHLGLNGRLLQIAMVAAAYALVIVRLIPHS